MVKPKSKPQDPTSSAASALPSPTEAAAGESWWLFRNDAEAVKHLDPAERRKRNAGNGKQSWPEAPPWRRFREKDAVVDADPAPATGPQPGQEITADPPPAETGMNINYWDELDAITPSLAPDDQRGRTFRLPRDSSKKLTARGERILLAVNAAIHLRRPLLVTGLPGSGKTSLAYAIAAELGLGPVLVWPIMPRSRLVEDGLYRYDALARLQQADLNRKEADSAGKSPPAPPIDSFIRLGPVGTAFLPSRWPRVLLIDEIDKGDLQLPSELLHLFEEGRYEISELTRAQTKSQKGGFQIRTADATARQGDNGGQDEPLEVALTSGFVRCQEFPIVVMTSNREREFPPAFNRRCIRIGMPPPDEEALVPIVEAHFDGQPKGADMRQEIQAFLGKVALDVSSGEPGANTASVSNEGTEAIKDRAVDQLLNAMFLLTRQVEDGPTQEQRTELRRILYRNLSDPSDDPDSDPNRPTR